MMSLWNNDEGSHHGRYAGVEPSWSWPKPVQTPRPPIHIGARAGRRVFDDIAAYGDGWITIEGWDSSSTGPAATVSARIEQLRAAFERAGRPPEQARMTVTSSMGEPATLDRYQAAGVHRVVVWLPPATESEVMAALDTHTRRLGDVIRGKAAEPG